MPRTKNRFKKVYLICSNNKIFGDENFQAVNMYRQRSYAEGVAKSQQQLAHDEIKLMWNEKKPVKKITMHGFYLVHESYFEGKDEE